MVTLDVVALGSVLADEIDDVVEGGGEVCREGAATGCVEDAGEDIGERVDMRHAAIEAETLDIGLDGGERANRRARARVLAAALRCHRLSAA